MIDNGDCLVVHSEGNPIFGLPLQVKSSDNRDCENRKNGDNGVMSEKGPTQPEAIEILRRLDASGRSQADLARHLGLASNKITKIRYGERRMQAGEVSAAAAWLDQIEAAGNFPMEPEYPEVDPQIDYVSVEILPTYAGAGGGGNGDGDRRCALLPRSLIVEELRGKADDFLLIDIRGDSMEPDFRHGDRLLVDKRDRSIAQPGPFALWDGEWGEYVVKNLERIGTGRVRMFSTNAKYTPVEIMHDETRIIGRPVYFGRRL